MLTWWVALCRVQPFLNHDAKIRQFPDTTKFQRVIRRDFQHAFNLKPVKQSNSPFCAPQLILFQKRKHRVKEKKTQHLIQYSVIQFFFKGLLFTPLKSKVYILSIYLYIYNIIIKIHYKITNPFLPVFQPLYPCKGLKKN